MALQSWLIILQILILGILVPGAGFLYKIWANELAHLQTSLDVLTVQLQIVDRRVAKIEGFLEAQREA